jgi:hypothetical protein
MSKTTIVLVIAGVAVIVLGPLLKKLYEKLGVDFKQSVDSWTAYFRGPGILQLLFLILGGVGAGASVANAPPLRTLTGEVKEYQIDPEKPALYQENIANYPKLTILARAPEPTENAHAKLTIFRNGKTSGSGETKELDVTSAYWTRVDMQNSYSTMGLLAGPSTVPGATQATKVEVMVYLKSE